MGVLDGRRGQRAPLRGCAGWERRPRGPSIPLSVDVFQLHYPRHLTLIVVVVVVVGLLEGILNSSREEEVINDCIHVYVPMVSLI